MYATPFVTEVDQFAPLYLPSLRRFILANTEQLHEKISELQSRIADLEEALAVSHATHSNHPHPLLRPELLALKTPLGAELVRRGSQNQSPGQVQSPEPQEEALESFGTLTIGEGGVSTFYGSTVGSEFLFEVRSVLGFSDSTILSLVAEAQATVSIGR